MSLRIRRCLLVLEQVLLVPTLLVVLLPAPAGAADHDWINSAGGFFQQTANWDPAIVPGAADRAIFSLNGNYTVSFFGGRTNSRFLLQRDTVNFNLNGAEYALTNTGSTSFIVGQGTVFGGTGRFTMSNGTISAVSGEIGRNTSTLTLGGTGFATITTGGTLRFSGLLAVGSGAPGTITVENGADLLSSITTVGLDASGAMNLSGTGTTWTNTNWIDVGGNMPASLSITSGAQVTSGSASVGPTSTGTATVSGVNSRWNQATDLRIGEFSGTGLLNINNGGVVHQSNLGAVGIIGDQFNARGTVNVDGVNSRWTNAGGEIHIGHIGQATLNISNSGLVSSGAFATSVGHSGGADGSVTIGGNNATLSARSLYVGGNPSTDGGDGSITINSDGAVQVGDSGVTKIWPGGRIDLAGGMLQTGSLQLAGGSFNWFTGTLFISGPALAINSTGVLGANPTIGTDKMLVANDLIVAAGSLNISGGGDVSCTTARIGENFAADGTANVAGAGSTWTMNQLRLGEFGDASINLSNGAMVTSPTFGVGQAVIAVQTTSFARVTIDGTGSVWDASASNPAPGVLSVGSFGQASVQISNGGLWKNDFTSIDLGAGTGSIGSVSLTSGSTWEVGHDVRVGWEGTGHLSITGGSTASALATTLGHGSNGDGHVSVSDPGSSWTNSNELVIGNFGTGVATFSNGATVAAGNSYVALASGSVGGAVLQDPGTTWVSNGPMGQLIIGGGGNGSLTILNGATATAAETIIGDGTGAVGSIIINGPGSRLDSPELAVGFSGNGSLIISANAVVQTEETFVPVAASGKGHIRIDGGSLLATTRLVIRNNGQVLYTAGALEIGALELQDNALLSLGSGGDKVVHTTGLAIDTPGGSTIDLADNVMIVEYSGASPLNTVRAAISNAYNSGNWDNPGITSFLADNSEVAVGYAEASSIFTSFPAMFAGRFVDSTSILIDVTRYGDANLDGAVNLSDFNRLAANFGLTGTTWSSGDFTFDGITNLQDFNKLAANFGLSAGPDGPTPEDWANVAAAVPEPGAAWAVFACCAATAIRPQRRE